VVGFCSFWRVLDELHINNLAVLPEYRRAHIGTALLRRVLEDGARLGASRATLEVRRSNEAARMLYEKFGFSVAGGALGVGSTTTSSGTVRRSMTSATCARGRW